MRNPRSTFRKWLTHRRLRSEGGAFCSRLGGKTRRNRQERPPRRPFLSHETCLSGPQNGPYCNAVRPVLPANSGLPAVLPPPCRRAAAAKRPSDICFAALPSVNFRYVLFTPLHGVAGPAAHPRWACCMMAWCIEGSFSLPFSLFFLYLHAKTGY